VQVTPRRKRSGAIARPLIAYGEVSPIRTWTLKSADLMPRQPARNSAR
jgi:hypothetical protein